MSSYGIAIDLDKCNGCYACFLACRDEHWGNDHPPYSLAQPLRGETWMSIAEKERGQFPRVKVSYIPRMCVHCGEAPCLMAATGGAVYRRPDGIVMIDPDKAVGQSQIALACPHRVVSWNEQTGVPQKCTMCAHLLDQGFQEPRCVEACPTGALVFGDLEDERSEVHRLFALERAQDLHPEYGLAPRVKYLGLPKRFVAGTIVLGDSDECGAGAEVTLRGDGLLLSVVSNGFGDFEFEGLEEGEYTLATCLKGYQPHTLSVTCRTDQYAGEIVLERAAIG